MIRFNQTYPQATIEYAQGGLGEFFREFCCRPDGPWKRYGSPMLPGTINLQLEALPDLSYYRPQNTFLFLYKSTVPEHSFLFQYQPAEDNFHRRLTNKLRSACGYFEASKDEFLSTEQYLALLKSVLNLIPTKQRE